MVLIEKLISIQQKFKQPQYLAFEKNGFFYESIKLNSDEQ